MNKELVREFDGVVVGWPNGPFMWWRPGLPLSPTTVKTVSGRAVVDRFIRERGCPHLRDELLKRVDSQVVVNLAKWNKPEEVPPEEAPPKPSGKRITITMHDEL